MAAVVVGDGRHGRHLCSINLQDGYCSTPRCVVFPFEQLRGILFQYWFSFSFSSTDFHLGRADPTLRGVITIQPCQGAAKRAQICSGSSKTSWVAIVLRTRADEHRPERKLVGLGTSSRRVRSRLGIVVVTVYSDRRQ